MTSEERRLGQLDKIEHYLREKVPDQVIEKWPPDGRIRVIRNVVIHEVTFGRDFLDDHADPVASLNAWSFLSHLKRLGSKPVWVSTKGLSP